MNALEQSGGKNRAKNLVDRVANASAFGAEVVEAALKSGAEIVFSGSIGKKEGGVLLLGDGTKKIALNANMTDARLTTALVRLSRTVMQGGERLQQMSVKSALLTARARTADAVAHEAAAAYEMRSSDPEAYQAFFDKNTKIAGVYFYTRHESGNEAKAMEQAVRAWYDSPEKVAASDEAVMTYMIKTRHEKAAGIEMSPEKLEKIFDRDGKSYVGRGFLQSAKAAALSDDLAARAANVEKVRRIENNVSTARLVGAAFDGRRSGR